MWPRPRASLGEPLVPRPATLSMDGTNVVCLTIGVKFLHQHHKGMCSGLRALDMIMKTRRLEGMAEFGTQKGTGSRCRQLP